MLPPLAIIYLIFMFFFQFSGKNFALASPDFSQGSPIQKFQEDSLKKIDTLLKDKEFQNVVSTLEAKASCFATNSSFARISKDAGSFSKGCQTEKGLEKFPNLTSEDKFKPKNFYIFVSFSLGEKALLNIAQEAKKWNATLVLRGFKEGSYLKTAKALQKIIQETGQGFIIDPELFTLFAIQAVPTFVLNKPFQLNALEYTQTPIHDRIQGHVSTQYALEIFAKEGDLKDEVKALLKAGEAK